MEHVELIVDEALRLGRLMLAGRITKTEARMRMMSYEQMLALRNGRHAPSNGG